MYQSWGAVNTVCLAVVGLQLSTKVNWSLEIKSSASLLLSCLQAPSLAGGVALESLSANVSAAFQIFPFEL